MFPLDRRRFLGAGAAAAVGLAAPAVLRAAGADKKLVVAVMGLSRGLGHVSACLAIPDVEIAYVCDVDDDRLAKGVAAASKGNAKASRPVKGVKDFRTILDDKSVDVLTIAAPNHWHAPATIPACAAGKHVYVEKPGSHNAQEAEWIVAAARKHNRVVQMGNQRRSWPAIREAIDKVRGGAIGTVRTARTWYNANRGAIGVGKPTAVPARLDYALWQGPAPERPYKDNVVPYNWHWRWHWGGGELANNGIHALDIARWGLGVDYPKRVSCAGGRFHFADDQETPDTALATFDFGDKVALWDCSSCHQRSGDGLAFVTFYGDGGSIALSGGDSYKIFDPKGKEIGKGSGSGGDRGHFVDFFEAIRSNARPHSDIEEGQKSTLLCHLGNIAYRTGRTLTLDDKGHPLPTDKEARALWGRDYRAGWEPKV